MLTKGIEMPCLRPAVVSLLRLTKVYVPYRFDCIYSLPLFLVGQGRAKCLAHISSVIRLMEYVDDHKPDYGRLTDDELDSKIRQILSSA